MELEGWFPRSDFNSGLWNIRALLEVEAHASYSYSYSPLSLCGVLFPWDSSSPVCIACRHRDGQLLLTVIRYACEFLHQLSEAACVCLNKCCRNCNLLGSGYFKRGWASRRMAWAWVGFLHRHESILLSEALLAPAIWRRKWGWRMQWIGSREVKSSSVFLGGTVFIHHCSGVGHSWNESLKEKLNHKSKNT